MIAAPSTHRLLMPRVHGLHRPQADEAEHHMVALGDLGHPGVDLHHHAGALVAADHGQLHRHVTGDQMVIGRAQPARGQLDHDLVGLGPVELDLLDLPLLAQAPQHAGFRLHAFSPSSRGSRWPAAG